MHYVQVFSGGPVDGGDSRSNTDKNYPLFTLRAMGNLVYGIYQYERSNVTEQTTERHYKYVRSIPVADAEEFLRLNNEWFS